MRSDSTVYIIEVETRKVARRGAALATFFLVACASAAGSRPALSGRVLDGAGGPIPGATVFAHRISGEPYDATAIPGPNGEYVFDALPDGSYAVRAAASGFVSVSYEPLRIVFPNGVQRDFTLVVADVGSGDGVYSSSELVGELITQGRRVSGATICLVSIDPKRKPSCTTTNRLGQYFLAVEPGLYTVGVSTREGLNADYPLDMRIVGEYRNRVSVRPERELEIELRLDGIASRVAGDTPRGRASAGQVNVSVRQSFGILFGFTNRNARSIFARLASPSDGRQ